jgi:hypothetical protein
MLACIVRAKSLSQGTCSKNAVIAIEISMVSTAVYGLSLEPVEQRDAGLGLRVRLSAPSYLWVLPSGHQGWLPPPSSPLQNGDYGRDSKENV